MENQVEAGRDTSITDRVKMASKYCLHNYVYTHNNIYIYVASDTAGVIGDNVDNDVVGVVTDVVKEQADADDDVTVTQRLGMAGGTILQGTSEMVDNDIGSGTVQCYIIGRLLIYYYYY